jgi:hypothetical protein
MTLVAMSAPWVLVQIGLLLGMLVGTLVWLGRRARASEPGIVKPIRLGAHHSLHIVIVEDRRLLVGTGPGAAPQLICDLGERPRGGRHADDKPKTNGESSGGSRDGVGLGDLTSRSRSRPEWGIAARPRGGWDQGV